MLSLIYPFGFLVSLTGLILWFYFRETEKSRLMSQLFLGGFGIYAVSLAFADGDTGYKLLILFRDLVVLAVVSQYFGIIKRYRKVFFMSLVLMYGIWFFYYGSVMKNTFPQESPWVEGAASIPLAEEAELIIELKNGASIEALAAISERYNLKFERAFHPNDGTKTDLDDYYTVDVPAGAEEKIREIAVALSRSGYTDWVEENEVIQIAPLDAPVMRHQKTYPVNDPDVDKLWGFDKMQVGRLYDLLRKPDIQPQRKALVAILDTGVDGTHEDLKANFTSLKNEYDNDPLGHGTHCAGIAGAVSNNAIGIASFAPDNEFVRITSIKVLNAAGRGTQRTITNGIIAAADAGADVISLSLGGRSTRLHQRAYQQAVNYANEAGAIVVVAAGNANQNARYFSPANVKGVIAVSAVDTVLRKASFSNTVEDLKMGIAAPGVSIYSTLPNDRYSSFNGTSMATPYVSGLVGVMKSIQPRLSTKQIYSILRKTGMDTGDTPKTGKLIQPAAAIEDLSD